MEIINGSCNWKLKIRRSSSHITVLRAYTCDSCAVLPDTLFSLPVRVIGDHALAYGSRDVAGEEVEIRCGMPDAPFDNSRLTDLTLPSGTDSIENYAFLNCRNLRTLRLTDNVRHFGCELFMNCRSLSAITLTVPDNASGMTLPAFAGSLSKCMLFTVRSAERPDFSFVLPEFFEDYEENAPNHDFTLHVTGGGVAYRMCFKNGELDFKSYDALWNAFLSKYHEPDTALLLAWNRLRYPEQLEPSAAADYSKYLLSRGDEVFRMLLEARDMSGLILFSGLAENDSGLISRALDMARSMQRTEAVALLLEKQRGRTPAGLYSFDL